MKVVSAMNALKGALNSLEASEAVAEGLGDAGVDSLRFPLADGGDGTIEVLEFLLGGSRLNAEVFDPLGRRITASYLRVGDTAVVESARPSGIALLRQDELDPLKASSIGTGQLMARAARDGAKRIVLGLGGSATNDGGLGLLVGLGARPTGTNEKGGKGLMSVRDIDLDPAMESLRDVELTIASDVLNPLLGPEGATLTYGPQKGVTGSMMHKLEEAMARWCAILERRTGRSLSTEPGAGAAGGMGVASLALGGSVRLGAELILELGDFRGKTRDCKALITGEGRIDGQTRYGKAPLVVARLFKETTGRVAIGLAGTLGEGYEKLRPPFDSFFSISVGPMRLEESIAKSRSLLKQAGREVGHLLIALPQVR